MLTLNDITTLARMAGAASLWRGCCGLSFDLAKAAVPLLREQWWWDAVHSAKTDIQADPSPQSDRAAFFAARQKLLRRALRAGEMCPDDRRQAWKTLRRRRRIKRRFRVEMAHYGWG